MLLAIYFDIKIVKRTPDLKKMWDFGAHITKYTKCKTRLAEDKACKFKYSQKGKEESLFFSSIYLTNVFNKDRKLKVLHNYNILNTIKNSNYDKFAWELLSQRMIHNKSEK